MDITILLTAFIQIVTNMLIGYSYYGKKFTSIVRKNNFIGCQFHPEKSSDVGEKFIKNFISLI